MSDAWLFPGQGSQAVGMGRALWQASAEARRIFQAADETLGWQLSRVCFEGPAEELRRTQTTQPALLTVSAAAAAVLRAAGGRPDAVAGHSLGEYSALVAAGALPFEQAVRAVHLRGTFMQEAVPEGRGAMAAILGLPDAAVEDLCREAAEGEVLSPANLNGGGQVVIAGHAAAVERACARARAKGAKRAVLLEVSAPFHCPLMEPAAGRLAEVLAGMDFRDASIPVWSNVDAQPRQRADDLRQALVRQVTAPVRWAETMTRLAGRGFDRFLEVGPGTVLAGLARRIVPGAGVLPAGDPEAIAAACPAS